MNNHDLHISELESAKSQLVNCTSAFDIENAETWIRIIELEIKIRNDENNSSQP